MRWLDQVILLFRRIIDWRPQSRPSRWTIVLLVSVALVGLGALFAGVFILSHLFLAPLAIILGATVTTVFGFPAFRCIQATILGHRVQKLLGDGQATYLMPGAFTHVLVHPKLPNDVILVKRGKRAIERLVSQGPRQSAHGEWLIYRQLFARRLAVRTLRVGKVPISDINILCGGNLLLAAVKGEERFVADAKIDEDVEIQIQERGIPVNEFLAKNVNDKVAIYRDFGQQIRRMWKSGFIDLDTAFRNYLIRVDEEGNPITRNDGFDILVHDFGCVFKLPEQTDQIEEFLEQRGAVAESRKAAISNGAFLMRSLTGRQEVEFAPHLFPNAGWDELHRVFNDEKSELPLAKRLKHHSNYKTIRTAHQALVHSICNVVNGQTSTRDV